MADGDQLVAFLKPDEDARALITRLLSYDLRSGVSVLDAVAAFRQGAAIEIDAAAQAGKSTLCMEAAARFILPKSWQGAHIGGVEGRVIFVDADFKFDFIHFLSICQGHLRKVLPPAQHGWVQPASALMSAALGRLTLATVRSSSDLVQALESFAESRHNESHPEDHPLLLVLDSATAFHAVDRAGGLDPRLYPPAAVPPPPMTLVAAHARMAAAVSRMCTRHVVVLATAAAAVQFEEAGLECKAALPPAWEEVVTSRLVLYRQLGEAGPLQAQHIARWLLPPQQVHYVLHQDGSCEAFS